MLKPLFRVCQRLVRMLLSSLTGALVVIIVIVVVHLNNRPDLHVWHKTVLDQEFSADSRVNDFSAYLALEDRLFSQLEQQVYDKIKPEDQNIHNRYFRASFSDPERWPVNWNRSFVLESDQPEIAVLLLHGMSDSPYSMRSIGQHLHERGAYVLGLRIPGHGQAPSGLLDVKWQDMAAAVRLAMDEVRRKSAGANVYIIGYSNGGALAVQYALDSLSNDTLDPVDGLVLISPEIGISKLAMLAKWQERLGHLLGLEKLAWNDLLPEFEPWKYGSFALNAGKQAWLITEEIQMQISTLAGTGKLGRMPPILAFQSVVDATVTAPALVDNLFERLPEISSESAHNAPARHELVLYDINRYSDIQPLMKQSPSSWIEPMLDNMEYRFLLTFLSNKGTTDKEMMAVSRMPGSKEVEVCDTDMSLSLIHI